MESHEGVPQSDQASRSAGAVGRSLPTADIGFRGLIENASDIITILDGEGWIRYESPSAVRVVGHESSSRVGRSLYDFVHPGDLAEVMRVVANAIESPALTIPLEYRSRDIDGEWRIFEATAKNLIEEPSIAGIVMNSRDITQRKRAEEEQKRLTVVMDSSPDFVGTTDPHGRFSYVNEAARRLVGLDDDAMRAGVNLTDIHPRWVNELLVNEGIPTALRAGVWTGETAILGADGREIPVLEAILAHYLEEGGVRFLSMIARDITELKELEAELRQAQRLEAIGHLAAGIAHEINTPVQYLGDNIRFLAESFADLGALIKKYQEFLDAVRAGESPLELMAQIDAAAEEVDVDYLLEEFPRAVEQSLQGVESVSKIVRAMKEFSHPGTVEKTPTDINRAIETTLTVARSEWKYVAQVETRLDPQLPLVACLPGDFNQALLNIIVNAAHAIADARTEGDGSMGLITVTTARRASCIEIRIADTGVGIADEIRPHIYDPFFTTKGVGRGTGQGLTLARSIIVEKHGGTLSFETELGKGTTFIIQLPLLTSREEAA